ncbi:MAG: hypothetical protein RLN76_05985 [Phycisphaeraceae bacterium]
MKVTIDSNQVTLDGQTLGEVLDEARILLEDQGRVIASVELDGSPLVGDGLDDSRDLEIVDGALSLGSEDVTMLATSALGEVDEALLAAEGLQTEAADLLQGDDPIPAFEKIGQAMSIWMQAQQAVAQAAIITGIDLEELTIEERSASDDIEHLRERLEQLKDMMVRGDTVALADTLAYEWPESVGRWRGLVRGLTDQIVNHP